MNFAHGATYTNSRLQLITGDDMHEKGWNTGTGLRKQASSSHENQKNTRLKWNEILENRSQGTEIFDDGPWHGCSSCRKCGSCFYSFVHYRSNLKPNQIWHQYIIACAYMLPIVGETVLTCHFWRRKWILRTTMFAVTRQTTLKMNWMRGFEWIGTFKEQKRQSKFSWGEHIFARTDIEFNMGSAQWKMSWNFSFFKKLMKYS